MTISQLIVALQQQKKKHGDINVYVNDSSGDEADIYKILFIKHCDDNNKGIILDSGNSKYHWLY